jgi:hypothetical protein
MDVTDISHIEFHMPRHKTWQCTGDIIKRFWLILNFLNYTVTNTMFYLFILPALNPK